MKFPLEHPANQFIRLYKVGYILIGRFAAIKDVYVQLSNRVAA